MHTYGTQQAWRLHHRFGSMFAVDILHLTLLYSPLFVEGPYIILLFSNIHIFRKSWAITTWRFYTSLIQHIGISFTLIYILFLFLLIQTLFEAVTKPCSSAMKSLKITLIPFCMKWSRCNDHLAFILIDNLFFCDTRNLLITNKVVFPALVPLSTLLQE